MTVSFKNQTVTVVRPTEWIDERGDRFPNWETAAEHDLVGCRLQRRERLEWFRDD